MVKPTYGDVSANRFASLYIKTERSSRWCLIHFMKSGMELAYGNKPTKEA